MNDMFNQCVEAITDLSIDEQLQSRLEILSVCRSERVRCFINAAFDAAASRRPMMLPEGGRSHDKA